MKGARLNYLARKVHLLATEDKPKKLAAQVAEVSPCWNQLVPILGADGDPLLEEDGHSIVRQLEFAATPGNLL